MSGLRGEQEAGVLRIFVLGEQQASTPRPTDVASDARRIPYCLPRNVIHNDRLPKATIPEYICKHFRGFSPENTQGTE